MTDRRLALHALWRPGLGLALWPAVDGVAEPPGPDALGELTPLPAGVTDLLAHRRLRHTVEVAEPGGVRALRRAAVVGVPTAVELLDRCEHLTIGGELAFYRYLLAGARAAIAAGAVAPVAQSVDAEVLLRWQPLPTAAWQAWFTVAAAGAPPALRAAGDEPVADFLAEAVDAEVRRRLASAPVLTRVPLIESLSRPAAPALPAESAGRALPAWREWCDTSRPEGATLVLRLHEPDDDAGDGHNGYGDNGFGDNGFGDNGFGEATSSVPDPAAVRWRLQVCRRTPDGHIEPVPLHRIDPHDLDAITTELARALAVFDELGRAETDPHSLDYLLSTDAVAEFLATGAAAITAAGVTVLLPRTIAEVSPTLGLRAAGLPGGGNRPGLVGLDEISDFEWRLALGEGPEAVPLSQEDLDELARQHGDLVRIRGHWVRAENAALSRAASFITAQRALAAGGARPDMAELLAMVTDPDDRLPVPVARVEGLGWLDDIASGGVLRPEPLAPPAGLAATLRPYQQRGLEWLNSLCAIGAGGVLADDMGLGKTVQVIALMLARHEAEPDPPGPALVVCPMSVIGNWQRELSRFAPGLRVIVHHGPRRSVDGLASAAADVVLTTFATLSRDAAGLRDLSWDLLVVDEAQHVKNVRTAAAKALRGLRVRRRVALTGTPVENRLEDLRAVIDLVNPGLLGSPAQFRARFAEPIERERDPQALSRLNALTRPFILRRLKTDPAIAGDLPPKNELTVRANLTAEQAGLYQAILNDLHAALADKQHSGQRRRTVLAALTRLKQVCNHPAHYLADGSPMTRRGRHRSGKVELLSDIATTLIAEGDRALVFTQFAAFAHLLSEWLEPVIGTSVPVLHGGLPRTEREELVSGFSADDGPPLLVATLGAGGTGLNLVAANHVIHADRWWNPAVEEQATDRAYRIGQTRSVQVRRFVCVGTLEERIDELIAAKRELSALTVATGEGWLSDLGDDQLFDLLALRDEAVGE